MRKLAEFLRTHREPILREWDRRAQQQLPSTQGLSARARRDHFPQLLDAMAAALDREDSTQVALAELPISHALERWGQDFDLHEIVAEYRCLRRVVLETYLQHAELSGDRLADRLPPLITFDENVDRAIAAAVDHYALQRDQVRARFVAMISHDLRNPLGTISLNAGLLEHHDTHSAAGRKSLARLKVAAARMEEMIADMLALAQGHLGHGLPVTRVPMELWPLLRDAVDELAHTHPDRRIDLTDAADGDALSGCWDPLRLMQAVSNLVGNAIKHGRDPITISARAEGDGCVAIEVSSLGEVPAPLRDHLFRPFETRDPLHGTGLGLHIVAEVARAHGGSVELVADTPDESRFRMLLPRRPAPTPTA